ncbi:hypothetical protein OAN22_02360 [Alphaproteobacteria bacterium]|nr:hypothetical protein [Alphaproteobacteria bacterium]
MDNLSLRLLVSTFMLAGCTAPLHAEPEDEPPLREIKHFFTDKSGEFLINGVVFKSQKPDHVEIEIVAYKDGKPLKTSPKKPIMGCTKHDDFDPKKLKFQPLEDAGRTVGVFLQTGKKCKPKDAPTYQGTFIAIQPTEKKEEKKDSKKPPAPGWEANVFSFKSQKSLRIGPYAADEPSPGKPSKGIGAWGFDKGDPLPGYKKPLLKPTVNVLFPSDKKVVMEAGIVPNDPHKWHQDPKDRTPLGDFYAALSEFNVPGMNALVDDLLRGDDEKKWLTENGLHTDKKKLLAFIKDDLGAVRKTFDEKVGKVPVTMKLVVKKAKKMSHSRNKVNNL